MFIARVKVAIVAAVVVALACSGAAIAGGGPTTAQLQKEINKLRSDFDHLNTYIRDLQDAVKADQLSLDGDTSDINHLEKSTKGLEKDIKEEKEFVHGDGSRVMKVIKEEPLPKDSQVMVVAKCPEGWQVLGGGFAQGALSGVVIVSGPVQPPQGPGYEVQVLNPPTAGSTNTNVIAVAYCAPAGHPVVFGSSVPAAG